MGRAGPGLAVPELRIPGAGNRLAQRHIKIAQALARKWWIQLPDPDLADQVEGTDEFCA